MKRKRGTTARQRSGNRLQCDYLTCTPPSTLGFVRTAIRRSQDEVDGLPRQDFARDKFGGEFLVLRRKTADPNQPDLKESLKDTVK